MVTSYVFILSSQYYTDYYYYPVRSIAAASTTGHGTNIITGVAVGMKSTVIPILQISVAVVSTYHIGRTSGLGAPGEEGNSHTAGLLGTAVATMGEPNQLPSTRTHRFSRVPRRWPGYLLGEGVRADRRLVIKRTFAQGAGGHGSPSTS